MSDDLELAITMEIDAEEPLTPERVAEAVGAHQSLIVRLARLGVLDSIPSASGEMLLPARTVLRLHRMLRLRRDLRVNFAGATIILDLVEQLEILKRSSSLTSPDKEFTE